LNLRESFLGLAESYFVPYFPALDRITGDMKSSIFMYYIAFWMGKGNDKREGWVYKTQEELRRELNLSRYEQESVRKNLRMKGILEEKKMGVPSRLYFRINIDKAQEVWTNGFDLSHDEAYELAREISDTYSKELVRSAKNVGQALGNYISYRGILLERGAQCEVCGDLITEGPGIGGRNLQFHHVKAVASGGEHKAENIRIVHASCAGELEKIENPVC
jgi:hypothetical protein